MLIALPVRRFLLFMYLVEFFVFGGNSKWTKIPLVYNGPGLPHSLVSSGHTFGCLLELFCQNKTKNTVMWFTYQRYIVESLGCKDNIILIADVRQLFCNIWIFDDKCFSSAHWHVKFFFYILICIRAILSNAGRIFHVVVLFLAKTITECFKMFIYFSSVLIYSRVQVFDSVKVISYMSSVGLYIKAEHVLVPPSPQGGYWFQWCPLPFPHYNSNYIVTVYNYSFYLIKYHVKVICILQDWLFYGCIYSVQQKDIGHLRRSYL